MFFLRELSRSDLSEINKWRNDADLIKALGSPYRYIDQEVDDNWFNNYLASRSNNVRLAICEVESGRIVGAVYLLEIDWTHRCCEFAILIGDKQSQGKGLGEFATRGILTHAFLDLNLHRVHLTVLFTNPRAIHLYKKVGFIEEGCLRQSVFKNGKYVDLVQMAILSSEYVDAPSRVSAINVT